MSYLVDTNVLLRSIQVSYPLHAVAVDSISSLLRQDQELSITAQNLIEFWAVATRLQYTTAWDCRLMKLRNTWPILEPVSCYL